MGLFKKELPVRAQGGGRNVSCLHCGNDHFWPREVRLNSGASEFFDVAWASPEATALICSECGFLMHFMPEFLALEKR